MTSRKPSLAAIAVAILLAGATAASAEDKKGLGSELEHYFSVRTSLAGDKVEGIKEHAQRLAKSDDKDTAKAGARLAKARELSDARKAFGELSKALLARLEEARKKGDKLPEVFVFECEDQKPFGKWLQDSKEIGNPYQGTKGLKNGKLVDPRGDDSAPRADGDEPCPKGGKGGCPEGGDKGGKGGCPEGGDKGGKGGCPEGGDKGGKGGCPEGGGKGGKGGCPEGGDKGDY